MTVKGEELVQERIQKLWENTDFTSTLFESLTGYAVIAADFDGNVIAYNEGARQVYGYAPEEVFGRLNVEAFFPADFVEAGRFQRAVEVPDDGAVRVRGGEGAQGRATLPGH